MQPNIMYRSPHVQKYSEMNLRKLVKITYHVGSADKTKINEYLRNEPPQFYFFLKRDIADCIFDKHKQPDAKVRVYWIDEDGDEIEVVDQGDYDIFMSKRTERRHLHVAPIRLDASEKASSKNSTDIDQVHPNAKSVHLRIKCDGCKMAPIVGFRYKCIQCSNYELCEKCVMNHLHAEHMMVRINMSEPTLTQTKQANNEIPALKTFEDKDKVTDTSQTTPDISSPVLENVAQHVDLQYMKAAIQILNNFSEMFAKMFEPMEGGNVSGILSQVQPAAFPQQRKSSVSSTASSNVSTASTYSSTSDKDAQQSQAQTQTAATETLEKDGSVGVTSHEPVSTADVTQTPERRRSQSEETEWQIIAQQPIIETPLDTLVDILPSADSPKTSVKTPNVQLSKDLQAHNNQANLRDQQTKEEPQIETPSVAAPPVSATPPIAVPEENRSIPIYHRDPSINTAVLAMMAMGFSNEGAWLTQLIESVNGSIPQALDLMSGAGRNKQILDLDYVRR